MLASLGVMPSTTTGLCLDSFIHWVLQNSDTLSFILLLIDKRTSIRKRSFLLICHLFPPEIQFT